MPFIEIGHKGWQVLLRSSAYDIYHLQGYVKLEAWRSCGTPLGWISETKDNICIIPLIERRLPEKLFDLSSPYGYPGILAQKPLTGDVASYILQCFDKEAYEKHYVSSFIRLNPFLNSWDSLDISGRQVHCGHTVSINLKQDPCGFEADLRENHRRNILKLRKHGFFVRINNLEFLEDFAQAYRCTMWRLHASPFYNLDVDYFNELCRLLGSHLIFISVHFPGGLFAGGGICSEYSGIIQYLYGATTDQAVKFSPSKLMIGQAIKIGRQRGADFLHLGGSAGKDDNDGLYHFKEGFSKNRLLSDYRCIHFIHNEEAYRALPKVSDDYFPAYRSC